jgi:hypothetical protein
MELITTMQLHKKKIVLPDQSLNYLKRTYRKSIQKNICFFYTLILTKKRTKYKKEVILWIKKDILKQDIKTFIKI